MPKTLEFCARSYSNEGKGWILSKGKYSIL